MSLCPDIKADGTYTDFGGTLSKLVEVISMYNTCQLRHNALVDYETKKDKL